MNTNSLNLPPLRYKERDSPSINVNKVSKNVDITNLIKISIESTFFGYQGKFYEQTEGTTMGSPLSPVISKLFMEHFESKALETTPIKPWYWNRFVDDTLVI